jgi:dolichol-phosphate mannosyltransferase
LNATDATARTLVAIATYNERENLPLLVEEVWRYLPSADVLVVDDNSPDGTGRWAAERAAHEPRLHCLMREAKAGLGTAAVAAIRFALRENYSLLVTMDADFSHHPRYLPQLAAAVNGTDGKDAVDIALGSRYVDGGDIRGWNMTRHLMSRLMNGYARVVLGLKPRDCTGAFRCYRCEVLRQLNLPRLRSRGYAYLEEILWRLTQLAATTREIPIVFVDRQRGHTKITWREALSAVGTISRCGLERWLGV